MTDVEIKWIALINKLIYDNNFDYHTFLHNMGQPSVSVRVYIARMGYGLDILCHDESPIVRRVVARLNYNTKLPIYDELECISISEENN